MLETRTRKRIDDYRDILLGNRHTTHYHNPRFLPENFCKLRNFSNYLYFCLWKMFFDS